MSAVSLDVVFKELDSVTQIILSELEDRMKAVATELKQLPVAELMPQSQSSLPGLASHLMALLLIADRVRAVHGTACGRPVAPKIESITASELRRICEGAARDFHSPRPMEDKPFAFSSGTDPALRVACDRVAARKCFYEVLNNAFKFSAAGAHVEIATKTAGKYLVVSISNRGAFSIDRNETKACLEFGYRGEQAKAYFGGTGHGLGFCDQLMRAPVGRGGGPSHRTGQADHHRPQVPAGMNRVGCKRK